MNRIILFLLICWTALSGVAQERPSVISVNAIHEQWSQEEASRSKIQLSVPLWTNRHFRLSGGAHYQFYRLDFENETLQSGEKGWNMGDSHHLYGPQLNLFFQGKIAGRSIMGTASVMTDFSEYGFGKVTGFVVAMTPLKQTASTYMGIGLIGLLNTTSPFPLFPIFTLRHKFDDRLSIELMLPLVHLKYAFPRSGTMLSAGMSIDGERFYVRPNQEDLPRTCLYSRSLMKPAVGCTQSIGSQLTLEVKGGVAVPMTSRLYKRSGHDELLEFSKPVRAFFSLGASWRLKK